MASSRVPACSLRSMCWGWLGAVPSLPLVPDTLTAVQALCDCGHLPGRWEKWEVLAQGFLLCESGRAAEKLTQCSVRVAVLVRSSLFSPQLRYRSGSLPGSGWPSLFFTPGFLLGSHSQEAWHWVPEPEQSMRGWSVQTVQAGEQGENGSEASSSGAAWPWGREGRGSLAGGCYTLLFPSEIRMQEMVSMGVGNKPFLDIKPSEAAINDRAIDYIMKGRGKCQLTLPPCCKRAGWG